MRIAGFTGESMVDGPGIRFLLFVQGCPHGCPGCHNPETHDFSGGTDITVGELVQKLRANPLLDGLTLSGGEPFCQARECAELCRRAGELGLNVWCYTGFTLEQLVAEGEPGRMELLGLADVLVDGPFIERERSLASLWRGSTNQRILDVPKSLAAGRAVEWEKPKYI